jgi:hypothetical protein
MKQKWQKPVKTYTHTKNPGPSRATLRAELTAAVIATAAPAYRDPPLAEYVASAGYDLGSSEPKQYSATR